MRLHRSFLSIATPLACLAGPSLLAIFYFSFLAQPVYQTAISFLPAHLDATANREAADVLEAFLYSPDLLEKIDSELDLHHHYTQALWDPIQRISADAGDDRLRLYFRDKVTLRTSSDANLLPLTVKAFSPEYSEALADSLYLSMGEMWARIDKGNQKMQQVPAAADHDEVPDMPAPFLTIAKAHTPDLPVYPSPFRGTTTILVLSFLIYGIGRLIAATIRDHTV